MKNIQALILDMDGVLWRADEPIGDLQAIFQLIEAAGWLVVLATNNATRSVDQYLAKLASFGVQLESWQIINSAQVAANYLQSLHPAGGNVYVVGEEALVSTLKAHGFRLEEREVIAVVASMDRSLSYEKLSRATLLVRAGAALVATNPDRTFPTPDGLVPGAGAILAALEAATDLQAVVVGKPEKEMFLQAMARMDATPDHTLVIGDRLETDIMGGQRVGAWTGLVMSGVTSAAMLESWAHPPDFTALDLSDLLAQLLNSI